MMTIILKSLLTADRKISDIGKLQIGVINIDRCNQIGIVRLTRHRGQRKVATVLFVKLKGANLFGIKQLFPILACYSRLRL